MDSLNHCCSCKNSCEEFLINFCEGCKGTLCDRCVDHHWKLQLYDDPNGVMRYIGSMVVFDKRGVGRRYCPECYKSIQITNVS